MKFFSVMYQTSNSKGQELVAQRMVKWARRLGHEAWLVTSVYHDGEPVIPSSEVLRRVEGYIVFDRDPRAGVPSIRVDSTKTLWPPRRIVFRDFITILRSIDENIGVDFILTHSTLWNGPEDTAKWVMWKRLMRSLGETVRYTVFAHMSHYQPPDPLRYSVIERAYRMAWNSTAFPAIFRTADLIVCVTGVEAEEMITYGARPDQIHLFPGGLDDDTAALIDNAKPDLFLERFKQARDKYIVAYLGTVEERKNPLAVVRIAKRLRRVRDIVFVIAGRPGDQWSEVVNEARGLENIIITGELSEELKASLIRASYLNIIMSRMEALGLTQIEFMYGGVPVITSGVYGQKWLVSNNVEGVHVNGPDDVESAARAVEELVKNPGRREEMSRAAREKASQFLMSRLMRELLDRASTLLGK
ncbi:MAG: glycosyltransferase family 4 protein [Sulfolobales archaeon]